MKGVRGLPRFNLEFIMSLYLISFWIKARSSQKLTIETPLLLSLETKWNHNLFNLGIPLGNEVKTKTLNST